MKTQLKKFLLPLMLLSLPLMATSFGGNNMELWTEINDPDTSTERLLELVKIKEAPNQIDRRYQIMNILESRGDIPSIIEGWGSIAKSTDVHIGYRLGAITSRIELEGRENAFGETLEILERIFEEPERSGQEKIDIAYILHSYGLEDMGIIGNLLTIFQNTTESQSVRGQAIALYINFEPDDLRHELNADELLRAKRCCSLTAKNNVLNAKKRIFSLNFLKEYGQDLLAQTYYDIAVGSCLLYDQFCVSFKIDAAIRLDELGENILAKAAWDLLSADEEYKTALRNFRIEQYYQYLSRLERTENPSY